MLSTISFLHRKLSFPGARNPIVYIPFLKQDLILLKEELKIQKYATGLSLSYSEITPSNLFVVFDIIQEINTSRTLDPNTSQTITFLNLTGNRATFAKMSDEQYRTLAHKLVNSGITSLELDGCSSISDNAAAVEEPSSDNAAAVEEPSSGNAVAVEGSSSGNDDVIEKLYEHILAIVKNPLEVKCEPVREAPAALLAGVSQNDAEEIDEKDIKREFNLKPINQPIVLTAAGRVSVRVRANAGYEQEPQPIYQHYRDDRMYFELPHRHFDFLHEQAGFLLNNLFKKLCIIRDIDSLIPRLRLQVAVDVTCDATGYRTVACALSEEEKRGALLSEKNEKHQKAADEEFMHTLGETERRDNGLRGDSKEQFIERPKTESEERERSAALHRRRKSRSRSCPNIFESLREVGTSASKKISQDRLEISGQIDSRFNRDRLLRAIKDIEEIAKQLVISHALVGNQESAESDRSIQRIIMLLKKHIMTYREMYLLWDALFVYCNEWQPVTRGDTERDLIASSYSDATMLDNDSADYYYQNLSDYNQDITQVGEKMKAYYDGGCYYSIIPGPDEAPPLPIGLWSRLYHQQGIWCIEDPKNKQDLQVRKKAMAAMGMFAENICESINNDKSLFGGCRHELSGTKKLSLLFSTSSDKKIERKIQDFIFELMHIIKQTPKLDRWTSEHLSSFKETLDKKQGQWLSLHGEFLKKSGPSCKKDLSLLHKELQAMNCISQIFSSFKKVVTQALEIDFAKCTKSIKSDSSQSSEYIPQPRMNF
jgi:hypothetical protein